MASAKDIHSPGKAAAAKMSTALRKAAAAAATGTATSAARSCSSSTARLSVPHVPLHRTFGAAVRTWHNRTFAAVRQCHSRLPPLPVRSVVSDVARRWGADLSRGMAMARDMTEDEYNNIANQLLDDILEKLEFEEDSRDSYEVNASGDGVIHVVQPAGTWVLNKQTPSRQIWLSSPLTGPTHYKLAGDEWVCTKDDHRMVDRLREQLFIDLD